MFLEARAVNPRRFIFHRAFSSIAIKIGISHRHFLRGAQRSRLNRIIRSGLETRVCLTSIRAPRRSRVSTMRHCVEFSKDSMQKALAIVVGSTREFACMRAWQRNARENARTHARTHARSVVDQCVRACPRLRALFIHGLAFGTYSSVLGKRHGRI